MADLKQALPCNVLVLSLFLKIALPLEVGEAKAVTLEVQLYKKMRGNCKKTFIFGAPLWPSITATYFILRKEAHNIEIIFTNIIFFFSFPVLQFVW